ncbi:MAG TPA: universal stress protein [Nitrospiraceae bacterium]|jgi:nucleotide-binding universal stress UspA family protein|nr:universal stress protein [Nitrospiraceae bacterium]
MGRYKKLLVAIDGSESSIHALRQSFKLAANEKSWITVVCVVPSYEGDLDLVGVGNIMESVRKPCEDVLAGVKSVAESEGALIKTVCEEGEAYQRIIDCAETENCEVIVMGRQGFGRLERALVGSVTARVIGYSRQDVLVVPRNTDLGWQRVLVATDGSKFSRAATERAIDFAEAYGGELRVLSVVDVPPEFYGEAPEVVDNLTKKARGYTEDVKKRAEERGIKTENFVREGETYRAIIDLAREQMADTIVLGSHGRTGLRRLLMGSVTEKVIGHAPCPILVGKA